MVDNNSRDQTREVVEDFRSRYPGRFRYLFEAQQGLSRARNAGIGQAQGEIVAFMDDDVTVDPGGCKISLGLSPELNGLARAVRFVRRRTSNRLDG